MNLTTDATFFRQKSREWFARGFVSQKEAKPELVWTPFPEPKELRLEEALHGLRDLVLGFFVRENTREWAPATFYWALFRAFANLHELATRQGDLFWEVPVGLTVFHFGWDASSPSVPRLVVNGRGPHEVLSAARLSVETMTEEDRELHFQAMLAGALHGAAPPGYRRDVGDSYAVHVPQSVKDALEKLPPEEREAEGWRRVSPFTMGAREWRPRESYGEPKTLRDPIPPPVSVRGDEVDGKPLYEVATFVELGQVVVEPGETGAHFPMLVGFTLSPDSAHPSTWPESERSSFWPALFSALEASLRENVPNAAKVPVSPHVTTTNLEPFFRSSVDASFPSSSLLSEESGLVRLPVEKAEDEEPVDEPPILVGIATETKSGGETVNVAVAGGALFVVRPPSPTGEKVSGPSETEIGMGHAGAIVSAARAIGVEVPEAFVFSAGQVFYKDRKLVEVRLSGFVNARLRDNGAGAGEIEASPWSTPVAPTLSADAEGVLSLAPADAGRTHLSAMVVRTANEPLAISLVWDLRENATPSKASSSLADATLAATGTVSGGGSDFPRELAAERPVEKKVFPLAFGQTLVDKSTALFVSHVHKIKLPAKKWSTLPSWWDLQKEEVTRLLTEHGEDAFKDYRSQEGRGPLLKKRTNAKGEQVVTLTAEAERTLKIAKGLSGGFRHVDGTNGREYFMRLFEAGSGYVEVGLSWFGLAGPWVEEWRRELRKQTLEAATPPKQTSLFSELEEEQQARINRLIARMQLLEDGQRLMGAIIGQLGRQGRNPVEVPALALRVLLKLETDPNWKARVDGALEALRACEFKLDTFGRQKEKAYGSFLGEWRYRGAGDGAHGEGSYSLFVLPGFLGCLRVFESQRRRLKSGREVVHYEFNRQITPEQKKELGWKPRRVTPEPEAFVHFDAGRPFYNAAAGLSPEQGNLMAFLEREITVRKSPVSRTLGDYATRSKLQAKKGATDANRPRLYTKAECPLLPEKTSFHAAIGNFKRNPEAAWRLGGTPRREGADGGAHTGGLIHELGYHYPNGSAKAERAEAVRKTLQDLKAVVEEYLAGVVAIRMKGGDWLSLETASKLPERELLDRASFFFFLPEDWHSKTKATWEAHQADRARRGETPFAWTVTESTEEAARARLALTGSDDLHRRLRIARKDRGLSQAAVGELFGVSQKTIATWEQGPEPDEDGTVHGKPISKDLRPLVARWVETGSEPTKAELEAVGKGTSQPSA